MSQHVIDQTSVRYLRNSNIEKEMEKSNQIGNYVKELGLDEENLMFEVKHQRFWNHTPKTVEIKDWRRL